MRPRLVGGCGSVPLSRLMAGVGATVVGPMVARYVRNQRDKLIELATPLPEVSKLRLRQHLGDDDLDRVRIVQADPLPIPNPPLYPLLRWLKLDLPEPALRRRLRS